MFAGLGAASGQAAPAVVITTQTPGSTPFIQLIGLTIDHPTALDYISFEVASKPGSVVRPVSARYSAAYLRNRGYYDTQTGAVIVPVFALYSNYANTVTLTAGFTTGVSESHQTTVITANYRGDLHKHPEIVQARTPDTSLSYDFFLLKDAAGPEEPTENVDSPLIIDTDGEIRWVGDGGPDGTSSIFYNNGVYQASGTMLVRRELDGGGAVVGDYAGPEATQFHHNIDVGRDGLIFELNTSTQVENTLVEVDPATGNVLHTWVMANIIGAAMTAGGDDPTQFIGLAPFDWFHSNAVTYRPSDNTLIVSSRENFVIALDYDTQAIKWILGDPTKHWHSFPSLRKYALDLAPGSHPPLGQHAVSVVRDRLLLFDDGFQSLNQMPVGKSRNYSAARKYRIDTAANLATETWNYTADRLLYSPVCSSVYEDQPKNFLLDYATENFLPTFQPTNLEIVGLNAAGEKVFDYKYRTLNTCGSGWNAQPIHLEAMVFN